MAFSDPIVAGEDLVRQSIKSPNYQQGLVGWAINKDGTAEFNNLNVVGTATGSSAAYDDITANNSFTYKGAELSDLINGMPQGLVGYGAFHIPAITGSVNKQLLGSFTFDAVLLNHCYKFTLSDFTWRQTTAGFGNGIEIAAYDETGAMIGHVQDLGGNAGDYLGHSYTIWVYMDGSLPLGSHTVDVYALEVGTSFNTIAHTAIMTMEDCGSAIANTGYAAAAPVVKTYNLSLNAYHSASYQGSGAKSTGSGANDDDLMYFGEDPGYSPNGNWRSYAWFNASSLAAMANYASCSKFDLYINTNWWYSTAGGTLYIGHHTDGSGSPPASEPGGHTYREVSKAYTARGQGQWISLLGNSTIMAAVKNGTFRGIVLGPGPSTSYNYYGYALGAGHSVPPAIRATYTK